MLPVFGGELFEYYDDYVRFDVGHHTVYHSDRSYWEGWHQADLANKGSRQISDQLRRFYQLSEAYYEHQK